MATPTLLESPFIHLTFVGVLSASPQREQRRGCGVCSHEGGLARKMGTVRLTVVTLTGMEGEAIAGRQEVGEEVSRSGSGSKSGFKGAGVLMD